MITVGGLRHIGTKVGFSDLGPELAISAPGGNCVNTAAGSPCLYPILTTTDGGHDHAGRADVVRTASIRRSARASPRRWCRGRSR